MPYLTQVEAHLQEARRLLGHAQPEEQNWPHCGNLLARALEHATTCAVFIAWEEPHAAEKKMHRHFYDRLMPYVDPAMAAIVTLVWEHEGERCQQDGVEQLLAACRGAVDYFAGLATGQPVAGWESQPIPQPVGWEGLSDEARSFLSEALAAAAEVAPGVSLVLFGSRAAGTARPDSDFDLFFIFPDQTADWQRPQSIGSVTRWAISHGIEVSVEFSSEDKWRNPPEVSEPLIRRVKASGVEVPR